MHPRLACMFCAKFAFGQFWRRRCAIVGNSAFDHCVEFTFEHPLKSESAITSRTVFIRTALCNKGSIVSSYQTLTYFIGCPNFPATLDNHANYRHNGIDLITINGIIISNFL